MWERREGGREGRGREGASEQASKRVSGEGGKEGGWLGWEKEMVVWNRENGDPCPRDRASRFSLLGNDQTSPTPLMLKLAPPLLGKMTSLPMDVYIYITIVLTLLS